MIDKDKRIEALQAEIKKLRDKVDYYEQDDELLRRSKENMASGDFDRIEAIERYIQHTITAEPDYFRKSLITTLIRAGIIDGVVEKADSIIAEMER